MGRHGTYPPKEAGIQDRDRIRWVLLKSSIPGEERAGKENRGRTPLLVSGWGAGFSRSAPEDPEEYTWGRLGFTDGSVKHLSYAIPNAIFQLLCRKGDGLIVDLSGF